MMKNVWPADIGQDPRKFPNPFRNESIAQSSLLSKQSGKVAAASSAADELNKSDVVDKHIEQILAR